LQQNGHSIECRIYAEDPENNFMPAPGKVTHIETPSGLGVRVDGYIYEGFEIPLYYDPLIAKLVVWGATRKEAIERTLRALHEFKVTGVKNNVRFLERIALAEDFVKGNYNTHFIEDNYDFLMQAGSNTQTDQDLVMIASLMEYLDKVKPVQPEAKATRKNNWKDYNRVRNVMKF